MVKPIRIPTCHNWQMHPPEVIEAGPIEDIASNTAPICVNMPLIFRNSLSSTVCQLLGVEDQVANLPTESIKRLPEGLVLAMQTTFFLPASLEVYEYISASDLDSDDFWQRRATVNGVELNELPSPFLCQGVGTYGFGPKESSKSHWQRLLDAGNLRVVRAFYHG